MNKKTSCEEKVISSKVKEEIKCKEWGDIMDDLFHQINSSVVSLEGYAAILSNEYGSKLDRKGKHYIRRIQKNVKEVVRVVRVLRECVNENGEEVQK